MSQMNLHILNAQKKLTAHCEWLQINLTDTYEQAKRLMPIHSLDVVVKAGKFVIPEKGHLGFCPEAGVIYITVDPENSAFCKNDAHSIERMDARHRGLNQGIININKRKQRGAHGFLMH